jgi:hypothetical protein
MIDETEQWVLLAMVNGEIEAEILRGLLEASDIQVFISREGISKIYTVSVPPLGLMRVMVPASQLEAARRVQADYQSGAYEGFNEGIEDDSEPDQG